MQKAYKTVRRGGEGEIVEKKSRFIATVRPVEDEEEAAAFIEEMKKKYWDARHNCSAFIVGTRQPVTRSSDDGEPSGTAGKPMLEVLLGEGLCNAAVVVTRYFGGTLLGTGGLIRAYSQAVREALRSCEIVTRRYGQKLTVQTDYSASGKVQYFLGELGISPIAVEYTDVVTTELIVPVSETDRFKKKITEATNGRAVILEGENMYYDS